MEMMEPGENPSMELVCVKNEDLPTNDLQLSYVNQDLQTVMQKMMQQIAMLTVAFMLLGMMFLNSIVHATIPLRSKWWIPFSVFLSVSIIYWYTMERIIRDYIQVRQEYDLTLNLVLNNGSTSSAGNEMNCMEKSNWFASYFISYRQNKYLFILLLSMLSFTSMILFACYSILRDEISLSDNS